MAANTGIVKTHRWVRAAAVAAVASLAWAASGCGSPAPAPAATPTVPEFEERIAAYLDVQKKAAADLPALKRTDDPAEIAARETAIGQAVRAARADAKPGDVMTPEVAAHFRRLIKADFQSRTPTEQKLMTDEIPPIRPKVNQTYPTDSPLATFPGKLLAVMPALPEGLEYRFLGHALIIRDIKANIIVDFILDVF